MTAFPGTRNYKYNNVYGKSIRNYQSKSALRIRKADSERSRMLGTVHNILNNKPASARSTYKAKVLNVAVRMANEALEATKGVSKAAAELETLHHGTAS